MHPDELILVESALRTQFGGSARLKLQDRSVRSRMNIVLERAERELGTRFCTYWVGNGPPEIFCLRGFSEPVIAFSPRYLEIWADLRRLMVFPAESSLKQDLIQNLILRIIAELSLTKDNQEFAGCCILRAAMDDSDIHFFPNDLMSLEYEKFGAPYMACWFYGLTHEMGHFSPLADGRGNFGLYTDDVFATICDGAIRSIEMPEPIEAEIRSVMMAKPGSFALGSEVLCTEMAADIFATSGLLGSMVEILKIQAENSAAEVDWADLFLTFTSEMFLSLLIIGILDRCRRIAISACTAEPERQFVLETVAHPAAISIRMDAITAYLQAAGAVFLFGDRPTEAQRKAVSGVIDSCFRDIAALLEDANGGLNRATRFCLDRQRRPSLFEDAGRWRDSLSAGKFGGRQGMVLDFLERARGLGKWAPGFEMIQNITADPSAEMTLHVGGKQTMFLCPWVDGPDNFSRPFGLETRHGHLIFVFASHSELFEKFSSISGEDLAEGFQMKSTALLARNHRELNRELALRLPVGQPFQAVIEGTPEFEELMLELSSGTIWPDD